MHTPEEYFKGIINMQYSIAHMYYTYWTSYIDGFMDQYEENVREVNEMEKSKPSKRRKKK